MSKTITISILVLAFVGGFLVFYGPKTIPDPTQDNADALNTPQKWESKTDEQASVTVTVTPTDISADSKEWKFDVVMSTHSVELDQDMIRVISLYDNQGREYKPIRWDGPSGGHHREGVLVFQSINPVPASVELIINGIGGVPERSLKWNLK